MLKKLFPLKFRVKIQHFVSGKYSVHYAYYRYIPNWKSLNFWFEQTLTSGTECWSMNLFKIDEAEKLAKSLKSIDDINEYYKDYKAKREDFYRRQKEYYNKNVPYKTKEIK